MLLVKGTKTAINVNASTERNFNIISDIVD